MAEFAATFQVQWADLDSNNHLRNTAYLDYAAQTRMLYFAAQDFSPEAFAEHSVGPVALEDTVTYRRELRLLQRFEVNFSCAGMSRSGAKFLIENRIVRDDGQLCGTVRTRGLWMNLKARKPVAPPDVLLRAMQSLPRTDDYADL